MAFLQDSFSKVASHPVTGKILEFLEPQPIRLLLGAFMTATAFTTIGYHQERAKEGKIPLAFSEIESIIKDFINKGLPVPALTKIYAINSDVQMKVFEASNEALKVSRSHHIFASELEYKMEKSFRVHALISEYAAEMPKLAENALAVLKPYTEANKDLPAVINAFQKTWTEYHQDVYKPVPRTSCDAKGNCTTTVEMVYDYTIHSYNYYPQWGEEADKLAEGFLAKHSNLNISENLYRARKTEADNEYAIESSMRDYFNKLKRSPTQEDYLNFANKWADGSTYQTNRGQIVGQHSAMKGSAPVWSSAKKTSRNQTYRTYSRTDSGPREYQAAKAVLHQAMSVQNLMAEVTNGIAAAGVGVPQLSNQINMYMKMVLDGEKYSEANITPDDLRQTIMSTARNLYQSNYKTGLDVQPFKWGRVGLWSVAGLLLGAGLGYGADRYLRSRQRGQYKTSSYTYRHRY